MLTEDHPRRQQLSEYGLQLASYPGSCWVERKRPWYPLFAHAHIYPLMNTCLGRSGREIIHLIDSVTYILAIISVYFWQQVHRVNKSNKPPPVSSVDGVSGSNHISQLFSFNLERLLNSQPSTGCDSRHISLLSSLSTDDLKTVSISEECIVAAFSHIKPL